MVPASLDRGGTGGYARGRMSRDDRCHQIVRDPDFAALVRRKATLILPATLFFVIYYFALPVAAAGWDGREHQLLKKFGVDSKE